MDIVELVPGYCVAPQIALADLQAIKDQGFTTIICNRPDAEITEDICAAEFAAKAESLGLTFVNNPMTNGQLTEENVAQQARVLAGGTGPVLAYCRSGTRCTILWSLVQADKMPVQDIIDTAAKAGYSIEHIRPLITSLAQK